MPRAVVIVEVGPRDGLQNEPDFVPSDDKIALIEDLAECGFARIEATAFVSPRWVPQMADHEHVMRRLKPRAGLRYSVLVPNEAGARAALEAGAQELAIFTAASEGFSRKNINCSIEESFVRFRPVLRLAQEQGIPVRGYVSCVTDCPYEGAVAPDKVAAVARQLIDLGCYEVALGETLGRATPERVEPMIDAVLRQVPAAQLAGHFHDTHGHALDNVQLCFDKGVRVFDGSINGLGGCPYAPGAAGNVATQALVRHFEARGIATGLDEARLGAITLGRAESR